MPPKHTRPFSPARLIFGFAAAILVFLVVWVAVRAVGPAEAGRQPTVVLPSMPRVTMAAVSVSPSVAAPVSASPSASPSRSRSVSPSVTPSPSATSARPSPSRSSASPRPSATTTTKPAVVRNDLAASLGVTASWNAGYVAFVKVENTGSAAVNWSVTVTHQGQDGLRLGAVWGAGGTQQGTSLVFTGGPLAGGGSVTFGYQTSTNGQNKARPAGCTVVGGTCAVR